MWSIFWFLLGVVITLYCILIMRKKAKNRAIEEDSDSIIIFYLNIFILNKDDVIKNAIKQKVSNKMVAGLIGKLAASQMSEDAFAERMGKKMSEQIPTKLAEVGVTSIVDIGYQQGAFVCIKVDIIKADARKLIAKKGGKEQLAKFNYFMDLVGLPQLNDSIDNSIASIIGERMQNHLPTTMRDRMQEKAGLDVKVVACTETEQSSFLLETLKELNAHKNKENKSKESA
jgi:hypothetical protein